MKNTSTAHSIRKKKGNKYIILEDHALIVMNSKTHGEKYCKIDLEDLEKCRKYTWGVIYAKNNESFYVKTHVRHPKKSTFLHRFIINYSSSMMVDHVNHDTLDNRKKNLRIANHSINSGNKKSALKNNLLGIRNVRYSTKLEKYIVRIRQKHIGVYKTIEEATKAAEKARNDLLITQL